MVAISNYPCDLMDTLYSPPKWQKILSSQKTIHSTKGTRVEALWMNYRMEALLSELEW